MSLKSILRKEKQQGIVFMDIAGSTALYERVGDQVAMELVSATLNTIRSLTEEAGGQVVRVIGDEALCLFPALSATLDAVVSIATAVKEHPALSPHGISLRVGVNFGAVIEDEAAELYGDAVNLAARLRGHALEKQILLPQSVVAEVRLPLMCEIRSLGEVHVKGKQEPVQVMELLWDADDSDLTMFATTIHSSQLTPSQIRFTHGEVEQVFTLEELPVSLGRGGDNDILVSQSDVSRKHAVVESHAGTFVIRDQSTNGTQLLVTGSSPVTLHRDHTHLTGSGTIVLGKKAHADGTNVISYTCF